MDNLTFIRQEFIDNVTEKFMVGCYRNIPTNTFLNMDEAAVYFEAKPSLTIRDAVSNTVADQLSGLQQQAMAFVSFTSDGKKLPLSFSLKAQKNGRVEKSLRIFLLPFVFACYQEEIGWAIHICIYNFKNFEILSWPVSENMFCFLMIPLVISK